MAALKNLYNEKMVFSSKKLFFQSKRGQLAYEALIIIIVSGIVVFTFVKAGEAYGSQEAFYKLAVAKDLALTIDSMYAIPGDVEYTYPNDISDYDIEIKENTIKIYNHKLGRKDITPASYSFVGLVTDLINTRIENKNLIKLKKVNSKITVSGVDK